MDTFCLLLVAVVPIAILFLFIYQKDKVRPEPPRWLLKGFIWGILSAIPAIIIQDSLLKLATIINYPETIIDGLLKAFCVAAIPEESLKLLMLWLLLRKNPHFDERFDGILYAVCVGLGFATIENILYAYNGLSTTILRAITAVPGHFFYAIIMGYFYSLYYFTGCKNKKTLALLIACPIVAHGLYDAILMSLPAIGLTFIPILIIELILLNRLAIYCRKRINEMVGK